MLLVEGQQNRQALDTMTQAIKVYKAIVKQIQQHAKIINNEGVLKDQIQLHELLGEFINLGMNISAAETTAILDNRFVNRLLEITTIYKNKYLSQGSFIPLKEMAEQMGKLIQVHHQQNPGKWVVLFQRMVTIFKQCLAEMKKKINGRGNLNSLKVLTPIANYSGVCCSISGQTSSKNSFENRYKLTKEVMSNLSLFSGLNIDVQSLKSIFLQSRNNLQNLCDDQMSNNKDIAKTREQYMSGYLEWKGRVRKKKSKTAKTQEKYCKSSPKKANRQNTIKIITNLMPNSTKRIKERPNRLDKTFIRLNEIKNQRYRKPYPEVRQVLVAGDQINYYSTKTCLKDISQPIRKASYFMNRAGRADYLVGRRKSTKDNSRLLTQ